MIRPVATNIIVFLIYLCASSCSNQNQDLLARPECHEHHPKLGYQVMEEIVIPIPEENPGKYIHSQLLQSSANSHFIYLDEQTDCLYFHSMEDGGFSHNVCLNDLRHKNIEGFFVHNLDSIFVYLSMFEVGLMDWEGKVVDSWKVSEYDDKSEEVPDYVLNSSRKCIFFDGKYLHLTLDPTDIWLKKPSERQPFGLAIEVSSGVKQEYGEYYGIYSRDTDGRELPFLRSYPYLRYQKDKVLVSLPFSHEASIHHWGKDELEAKFCASSNYLPNLAPLMPLDYDFQTRIHFQLENGFYGPLIYHEELELYSRQVEHNMELKSSKGHLNSPVSRPRSLLVFNKSLECIGEIDWPDNYLFLERSFPTPDGFWVLISKRGVENEVKLLRVKIGKSL